MKDSLSGRAFFLELLPFSIDELQNDGFGVNDPYELIFKGQYPPLYDEERNFILEDWFEAYLDTYIGRDVEEFINPSNVSIFKKFVQICAIHSGQMLSMDSIARAVGVSAPTIKSWLSILEQSYIIHLLEPASNSLTKSLVKSPKLYFVDTGLLCYLLRINSKEELLLHEMKGAIVETFAVAEMLKNRTNIGRKGNLTYFRDRTGFEVDTIADWRHTFAIEIKSTTQTDTKASKNLKKYLELTSDEKIQAAIFYLGNDTIKIDNIEYVSFKDWGKYSSQ